MRNHIFLEVCVDSVESALAAQRGGAQRIELCSNLLEGGVTPSAGLIAIVRERISIGLHVMIRPRGGDFCYTQDEFEIMRRDILMAKQLGADGVVFGVLDADGTVDTTRTRQLADLARPLSVTYHRAFDMSADLFRALEDIINTGVDRVLTSGGEQIVTEGLPTVRRLVQAANGRIIIMAGGGIEEHTARRVMQETGAQEIHAGLKSLVSSPMRYRNEKISMGTAKGCEYQRAIVPEKRVRGLLEAL